MASDQQRRELHLEPEELKNLQFIVLDLEELKQLHSIAKRPRVRSLLSTEIGNLKAKMVSNSTVSDEKPPEQESGKFKCMQKEVLPSDIDQLASSNLSVPKQEATEIAEKEAVPSSIEILAIKSSKIIESRNNQVMREENSSLQTQLAERGLNRKRKEIEKSESSKTKKLPKLTNIKRPLIIIKAATKAHNKNQIKGLSKELWSKYHRGTNNWKRTAMNIHVNLILFPSRSARRKYAQRQLKKEMKWRARELQEKWWGYNHE